MDDLLKLLQLRRNDLENLLKLLLLDVGELLQLVQLLGDCLERVLWTVPGRGQRVPERIRLTRGRKRRSESKACVHEISFLSRWTVG